MPPQTQNESIIIQLKPEVMEAMPGNREFGSGMSAKSIKELAESIKPRGILQPIIARPHPEKKGHFQIVAGVRRHAAATLLNLTKVPCIVRELADVEALELRSVENLQREGLHEMEEAREYQNLLDLKDAQGKPVHSIKSIAERIGKSEAYCYAKLKLLRMPDVAQEAFLKGKLNASVALLLCRIPDSKMAYKASLEVLDRYGSGITPEREKNALDPEREPMSFRQAKSHVSDNYMTRLKGAKFNQEDTELVLPQWLVTCEDRQLTLHCVKPPKAIAPGKPNVTKSHQGTLPGEWFVTDGNDYDLLGPVSKAQAEAFRELVAVGQPFTYERVAGGACGDCPWRTGNLKKLFPSLYGDVESSDVCTNTACFKSKEKATVKAEQDKFKEKGQLLAGANKARELVSDSLELQAAAREQFIDLKEKVPGKRITWEEALEAHLPEDAPPTVVVRAKQYYGNKQKTFYLLPKDDKVLAAAKAAGVKLDKPKPMVDGEEARKQAEAKRQAAKAQCEAVVALAYPALLAAAAKAKPDELLRMAAGELLCTHDFMDRRELDEQKDLEKAVAKMTLPELHVALFDSSIGQISDWQGEMDERFIELCKHFGVDLKKITESVKAPTKEAEAKAK